MTSLLGSFGGGASKKNVNNNANNATSTDPASSKLTAVAPANDNTPHYHFLHSMLLPSTVKIQKELRGRRFKVSVSAVYWMYVRFMGIVCVLYVCLCMFVLDTLPLFTHYTLSLSLSGSYQLYDRMHKPC